MKVHVKHSLKTDVAAAFKLCTEQKSQEQVYAKLGGSDIGLQRMLDVDFHGRSFLSIVRAVFVPDSSSPRRRRAMSLS